jgi:type I site-specific restriction-modification system R (restriction) subunit
MENTEFLPEIIKKEGILFIWDTIRKKYIQLTPEEWVRQKCIFLLVTKKNYPKGLFRVEKGLKFVENLKRTDILVYDTNGLPFLLVECKAQNVLLDENAFQQLLVYHAVHSTPYLVLYNEIDIKIWFFDKNTNHYQKIEDIPNFGE